MMQSANSTEIKTDNSSCCNSACATISTILNEKEHEQIAYTVSIYAIGDLIWSSFSYLNLGINLQPTNDTTFGVTGQWAGQQLYATLGMGLFSGAIAARYGIKKEYAKAADVMTIFAAGSLSIYTWDLAQSFGTNVFKNAGASNHAAGYYSSVFAGISEGLTQFIFIKLIKLLSDDAEYTHFKQDPRNYFLNLLIGLGLNSTIGAIPGCVWQLVFNAATIGTIGPAATALSVAASVALSAIASAKAHYAIVNSACYTTYCGSALIPEKNISPLSQCCLYLNGLFSQPDMNDNTNSDSLLSPVSNGTSTAQMY